MRPKLPDLKLKQVVAALLRAGFNIRFKGPAVFISEASHLEASWAHRRAVPEAPVFSGPCIRCLPSRRTPCSNRRWLLRARTEGLMTKRRRDESRRGTQECVRYTSFTRAALRFPI